MRVRAHRYRVSPEHTLTYWRRRLAASKNPHRIMEAIAEVIAETGVLQGKRRRAVDSTVLDDAVARQDTITQLIAAVRRFGRDVPGGQGLVAARAVGYDYTRTGKPAFAFRHGSFVWSGRGGGRRRRVGI